MSAAARSLRRASAVCVALALGGALGAAPARAVDRRLGAAVAPPAAVGQPWSAAAKATLATDIDALLAGAPTLRGAHVGLLVTDTRSGEVLYARDADDAFVPASTMKVLTGSAALTLLGADYRFTTEAYADAAGERLMIRAGGDPLLRSSDLAALAHAVSVAHVFAARPSLTLDAGAFASDPYPPGWSWDDFADDYAAKLSPLPIDENAFDLTVSPGARAGDPLVVAPASNDALRARLARAQLCGSSAGVTAAAGSPPDVDIVRRVGAGCDAVIGSLPVGGAAQTISTAVRDPDAAWPALLANLVAPSPALDLVPIPLDARLIWSHGGEPLGDLVADMWWPSDNFIAEMLLRAIGRQQRGNPGTTERGTDAERAWLTSIGVDPATLTIVDGSGLSTYDRLTPRALVAILQFDWNGPNRALVIDDLPLAGVRGTLANRFAGTLAARRTFAKTGSVSHARGLAGYLATLHHGAVTFAFAVDDWLGDDAGLDALRARVLARIIGD